MDHRRCLASAYISTHTPVVDQELWDEVQRVLVDNRVDRDGGARAREPSLLTGLLYDADGEAMSPSHAVKNGKRYRYYVSRSLNTESARDASGGMRIPASTLEQLVSAHLRDWLGDPVRLLNASGGDDHDAARQRQMIAKAKRLSGGWTEWSPEGLRSFFAAVISRVQVHRDRVEIALDSGQLAAHLALGEKTDHETVRSKRDCECTPITLTIPAQLKRVGVEMRMVLSGDDPNRAPNVNLIRLLIYASKLRDCLEQERNITLKEIAQRESVAGSYVTRLLRLTYLAPDIVNDIIAGDQPSELTARRLVNNARLPLAWAEQRSYFGFT
jgi:hypothetical protein